MELTLSLVFAILFGAFSAEAVMPNRCENLFQPHNSGLHEKLELLRQGEYRINVQGHALKIRGELQPGPLNPGTDDPLSLVARVTFKASPASEGSWVIDIGSSGVAYFSAARKLEIARTFMNSGFERKGLTTLFVGAALEMFPETETVTGHLIRDNAKMFVAAYAKSAAATDEAKMVEAFRETPFYKTLRPYGFTEIDVQASFYRPDKKEASDRLFIQLRRP